MRLIIVTALSVARAAVGTNFLLEAFPPALQSSKIGERDVQVGGKCGKQGGNAVCAAGLCCSEEGACGTGGYFCVSPACQISFGPGCDGNKSPPGEDTSSVLRPLFGNIPYGVDISRCKLPGKVALTFDDGPNQFTSELLDILKKNDAKATFFVNGANGGKGQMQDEATGFPNIMKRMHEEGHQIGSHSWSHEDLSVISPEQRHDQIVKNEISLVGILGFFPTYFRIPFSRGSDDVLADLKKFGYHSVSFNLDTHDTEEPNLKGDYQLARESFSSAMSKYSPADTSFITVAHDIQEKTVRGYTQYMIDQARQHKYDLVTVGECLEDHPSNWYRDPVTGGQFGSQPKEPEVVVKPGPAPTGSTSVSTSSRSSGGESSSGSSGVGTSAGSPSTANVPSGIAAPETTKPSRVERQPRASIAGIFLVVFSCSLLA